MDAVGRQKRRNADGEIRLGLFLDVHGRSLHVFLSGFLFVNVRWYSLKVVGVPVNFPVKILSPSNIAQWEKRNRRESNYLQDRSVSTCQVVPVWLACQD